MSDRTRLVFVRHGRTAFNVEGRLQGRLDMPLDEVGRRQALTVLKSSPRWNLTRSLPLRYNVRATQLRQSALVLDWAYSWMIDSSRSMSDVGRDNGLRTCVATILSTQQVWSALSITGAPMGRRRARSGIESLPCVRTLSRGTLAERSSCGPRVRAADRNLLAARRRLRCLTMHGRS